MQGVLGTSAAEAFSLIWGNFGISYYTLLHLTREKLMGLGDTLLIFPACLFRVYWLLPLQSRVRYAVPRSHTISHKERWGFVVLGESLSSSRFCKNWRTSEYVEFFLHNDLQIPPGNRLEALKGDRKGQHSIRINDQWRVCFNWKVGDAYDVEITDYH